VHRKGDFCEFVFSFSTALQEAQSVHSGFRPAAAGAGQTSKLAVAINMQNVQ